MKNFRFFQLLIVITITASSVWAGIDYKRDPAFNAGFAFGDQVITAYAQPDGKAIFGGMINNGAAFGDRPFVKRINLDGTTDPTFNCPVTAVNSGSVSRIVMLPGSKFMVFGSFEVGATRTRYARFNADGSFDSSLPLSNTYVIQDIQPDGKLLGCMINAPQNTFYFPIRVNTDGTRDMSFNPFVDQNFCPRMRVQSNGKIIISGAGVTRLTVSGQPAKPMYRLNPDGSQDTTFDVPIAAGGFAELTSILPDDRIMALAAANTTRFSADGAFEASTIACRSDFVLPLADGNFFMGECQRGGNQLAKSRFARVLANGALDPTYDHIDVSVSEPVIIQGMAADGNGGYYVYGELSRIENVPSYAIGHIIPETTPKRARFDFDGDGKSDLAVYRPSNGYWYLNQSSAGALFIPWGGLAGDKPIAGIFDTDQKTDVAVFRDGTWQAFTSVRGHAYTGFGQAGDRPFVGNMNASPAGEHDIAVRGLRDGVVKWEARVANTYLSGGYYSSPTVVPGELITDTPVIGDFTGDSRDEIGYFRDGYWYTLDILAPSRSRSFQWGMAGDIPVPGDYDGDRETDYAVFRPSTGVWWVNLTSGGYWAIQFGQNGDVPVPADYDGDGKADIAVFRDGVWWQFLSATQSLKVDYWGTAGDIPVPAQNQY